MLYLLPTPIGNLSDISQHALEILKSCEIIFCEDTRVSKKLLSLLEVKFSLKFETKEFFSVHSHNEESFLKNIDRSIFDKICVYMSDAGMPCISDPGYFLVRFVQENGIEYEVLSGSNALLLAAAASGIVQKEFIFVGFLSPKAKSRELEIQNLLNNLYPTIIYETPTRILNLLEIINKFDENREIFVIKEATKKFEFKIRQKVTKILQILNERNLNGEWCVVVAASQSSNTAKIALSDILELDIPKKQKAKLISKITGKSTKDIYEKLIL